METKPIRPIVKVGLVFALQLAIFLHITDCMTNGEISDPQSPLEEQDTENKSGEVNKNNSTIIYDVTGFNGEGYNIRSIHKSPLVYMLFNDNVSRNTCLRDFFNDCQGVYGIISLSLLLTGEHVQSFGTIDTFSIAEDTIPNLINNNGTLIHSIIMSVYTISGKKCDCHSRDNDLTSYFTHYLNLKTIKTKKLSSSVELGLEYNEDLIDCCSRTNLYSLRFVDFVVLRVQISPYSSFLRYSLFSEKIDALVERNRQFIQISNPKCRLHVRLVYQRFTNMSTPVNYRYTALFHNYAKSWTEEHPSSDITFIVSSFPENVSVQDNNQFLMTTAAPYIKLPICHSEWDGPIDLCKGIPQFFSHVSVELYIHSLNCNFSGWLTTKLASISFYTKANLSIFISYAEEVPTNLVRQLVNDADRFKIKTIYFNDYLIEVWNASLLVDVVNMMQTTKILIGCSLHIQPAFIRQNAVTVGKYHCKVINGVASKIFYYFWIHDDETWQSIVQLSWNLEYAKHVIEKTFPGTEAIPSILRTTREGDLKNISVYCDKYKQEYNEDYNAFATIANIHGWPSLYLRHLFYPQDQYSHKNWWQLVATTNEMKNTITQNFPVYVHTNGAKRMPSDMHFPNTYPCVVWTRRAPENVTGLLNNSLVGPTVTMDLRRGAELNPKELETMLTFAFGKFSSLELATRTGNDVAVATNVLTGRLLEIVRSEYNFPSRSNLVYLELPINLINSSSNFEKLPSNVAVHLVGWEEYKMDMNSLIDKNLNALANSHYFGITVANCSHQLNLNLTQLMSLPLLPLVKYVVCKVTPVEPDNSDQKWMDKYLGTMFYIKTYLEKFVPDRSQHVSNLEVIFRINLENDGVCQTDGNNFEEMLRFLNDLKQHSAIYKIRYFIVNAFSSEGSNCSKSWWRIENHTDLSNISVYTDIEEENFGRPTFPKFQLPSDDNEDTSVNPFVVAISVLSFFLFISFLAFWYNHKRLRKQFLTQKEITDFYNGVVVDSTNEYDQPENDKWLGMKFPKSFQLPKKSIKLGKLVGSGEFGEVFIGKLDGGPDVAIKVPRSNASVETFKSALSEVKIVCYVGDGTHPNVISFLGAYTNEIAEGKLYILTEYCHNGSLVGYLRATQADIRSGADNTSVDLYQLYRFAFEIASGMEYVSSKRVIHGDLATRNILLTSDHTCKISDFGLSRKLYEYSKYVKTSQEPLPWRWMAVESLKSMEFTTKSDVWSYAVTVWEIFTLGSQPYPGLSWTPNYVSDLEDGMRLGRTDYASDVIHEKLLECWNVSPDARPTFGELAEHFVGLRSDVYTTCHDVVPTTSGQVYENGEVNETKV